VARMSPLFELSDTALSFVLVIGGITALFMGLLGIVQNDIKRVVAYSTLSQLGYMTVALGASAYSAAVFHLMTHAFFKALLFLGAGAVIHGLHGEQDLRQMGGLFKYMRITAITLFCAGLAIAGIPFTSGAASKDLILEAAYLHAPWIYWVGTLTAGLTAFYVWRALFLCFFGEYRGHAHPHESPAVMWAPLAVLAALSLGGGFINIPHWLEPLFPVHEESVPALVRYMPFVMGFGGIALAYLCYVASPGLADAFTNSMSGLYKVFDAVYDAVIVKPLIGISRVFLWKGVDAGLIDGMVNGFGTRSRGIGGILRLLQSGNIRSYAAWIVLGSVVVLLAIGFAGDIR
jgi:NADH-quinone oxidoreductase subunit L